MAGTPPNTNEGTEKHTAKGAMFFAGLKILQTMNLCFAGSFSVLLRFGISPKKIGLFIGITGACLNFWAAMGDILGFVLGLSNMLAYLFPAGASVISTIALFIVQCRLTCVCLRCSGYDGVRKYFFWLCSSALLYQGDALLCTATLGLQSAYFFLALEITNVLIPFVHFIAWLFFRCFGGTDILFWKLCFQLGGMVLLTFVCVALWIACVGANCYRPGCGKQKSGGTPGNWGEAGSCAANNSVYAFHKAYGIADWGIRCFKHKATQAALNCRDRADPDSNWPSIVASPFFMGIIGMGSIFWLFPVIFPFMVCHYSHFESTQKFLLVLGAVATLIVWGISDGTKLHHGDSGFTNWCRNIGFHDWAYLHPQRQSPNDLRGKAQWNFTWFILLPVVFLTWMFFNCLHYPSGYLGRCILHSKWAVVWGSFHFFLTQLFKAFGLDGVFFNAIITAKLTALGNISFMLSMIHLVASIFTNEAYSNGYSSFKSAVNSGFSWPTQGLGGFRSFCWWHRYGVKNGAKRFVGLRRIDIVQVIS